MWFEREWKHAASLLRTMLNRVSRQKGPAWSSRSQESGGRTLLYYYYYHHHHHHHHQHHHQHHHHQHHHHPEFQFFPSFTEFKAGTTIKNHFNLFFLRISKLCSLNTLQAKFLSLDFETKTVQCA